ncbi:MULTISPECIES: MBL fold metallo-hydrolase [unclassified Rhizobium]|uniref:MBL fold metallo-hydrolase n=1 Tax=unclassified Rhizobium TaxID=2613769 RepID=UPI0016195792|nr:MULTISPECIES: MBL fold metallo-hydrolase [unclassified Rhizobium]MBB3545251.1 metallo-beta-lactamase family protein [Rhizobium sp. BK399]MCS3743228.1 metallo-beta-lactamase family protein [Rhizobium sp. BK661]MCS4096344.1 metallo-beta-lactamase family protein [Rhizobium sp. BK176]
MQEPKLSFHGAAGSVTGSCFLLDVADSKVLIDCGMFQGSKSEKELNYRPFPFDPTEIDAVLLTHAHIDHTGLLPKLAKEGFGGPVYATRPTMELCGVMLQDSGHIQESEVKQLNRRNRRRSREPVEPIYTADDARMVMAQFISVPYQQWQEVAGSIKFRFWNAGHLLGSASIEMEVAVVDGSRRLLFSGDIGTRYKMLEGLPQAPVGTDYLICESTYGDREREDYTQDDRRGRLKEIVAKANKPNGVLLIPSFAVERTQEVLTDLVALMDDGTIPRSPVMIDSPLASRATEVFKAQAGELANAGTFIRALNAPNVRFTESAEQSKALDLVRGFHIIIAASGMCEAGRIRHRLRNWLWRQECTVLLVGFQAAGTLGRVLQEGARMVRIQGDEILVKAKIITLDAYSGHADATELDEWVSARAPIAKGIFLVHGEPAARTALTRLLARTQKVPVIEPRLDDTFYLTREGACMAEDHTHARLTPEQLGRPDWHNDFQSLVLDLSQRLNLAADQKGRAIILRKIRRALEPDDEIAKAKTE